MTDIAEAVSMLREKRPVVHCITNYVTAGDTANMLLAAGASPVMADDPSEAAEIAACADALVLNMGTLSESRLSAMLSAGAAANKKGIPVILDPVGVRLSEFRRTSAKKILRTVKISAIRGNLSEILYLGGISAVSHGVDSAEGNPEALRLTAAVSCSKKYGCVCAVTGAEDIITDGGRSVRLLNGTEKLKRVTGAGCMTTALIGAFSAVSGIFEAAAFGTAFMGICGEISERQTGTHGMGSFRAGLFDAAGSGCEVFFGKIRAEE